MKPELVAYQQNSVWSWDITKLRGPAKWTYYYLYVILDIFSRYVVGWMVATRESAALAEVLIRQTCAKQGIGADQLTIHADRGSSMTSKPVAFLLADLGVTQSHSRPHVSDDNPFSESQFKTLKYRPDFPGRFDSIEAARRHCQTFFAWYNDDHHHGGLGLHTPADIHYGTAEAVRDKRAAVLADAYRAHPERFIRKPPEPPPLPTGSWINPPDQPEEPTQEIPLDGASFRLTASGLTPTETAVMQYVIDQTEQRGMLRVTCPGRDVAEYAKISHRTAARTLPALANKGLLIRYSRGRPGKDGTGKAAIYGLIDPGP